MNEDIFDGFTVNLFFDEDGDYLAHLVELPNVSAFGPTPAEALEELKPAWKLMKECYQMDGEPIPKPPSSVWCEVLRGSLRYAVLHSWQWTPGRLALPMARQ